MQTQAFLPSIERTLQCPTFPPASQNSCVGPGHTPLTKAHLPKRTISVACSRPGKPSSFSQTPSYFAMVCATNAALLETPTKSAPQRQDNTTALCIFITQTPQPSIQVPELSEERRV